MNDFTGLTEDDLLVLLQQDKLSAFKEIYRRYWKKLYGDAYKRLKNKELCEEVVQEIFSNLWHKRHTLQVNTTIAGYLHLAVLNQVVDQYRKQTIRAKHTEAFKLLSTEADNGTEDAIILRDLTQTLETEISHLPDKCRSVFELSRKQYKSNKEIAQLLGISEKTVENQITKAIKRLRMSLSHHLLLILAALLPKFF
ncbi:RNA polymerase sigma-70 factor (ECF subfamily) [Mucilaginibacter oryzae]|uniref:RNA polymerase sigma-70 factor (ECF subfamily) n=1 Tax=Mucilaginibacter oryzae TaxID=468058 RepID=A0A316HK64_9SPHI|nr:RNA polymerase sigma-70 factor [Mucilaginibacter oryzae]PWK80430.1 RNA polymerase sigma-70 factor (ECF subfamily) [Mucilaginibacter oryzae]